MFQLKFSPNFASQNRDFLRVEKTPALPLGPAIEAALAKPRGALPKTVNELWFDSFRFGLPIFGKAALAACFASFCATGSTLVAVHLLKVEGTFGQLLVFALGYYLLNSSAQFGNYATNRLRAEFSLVAENRLTSLISRKILNLSPRSALNQTTGNLKVLIIADVKNVSEFQNNFVRNLIPSFISVLVMAPFLVHFSGRAGVVGLLTLTLIVPVSIGLTAFGNKYVKQSLQKQDEHATLVGEWVKNIRLVRFLSWDASFEKRLDQAITEFLGRAIIVHVMACITFGLSTTWWMVTAASVLYFAKWAHTPLSVDSFFGTLWLLTFIGGYFTHLPNSIRLYGLAEPSMKRISTLLEEPEQSESFTPSRAISPLSSLTPIKIVFEKVSFDYPNGTKALKNICISLDLTHQTAILGEVGSGKTTFLKLLTGEYPPSDGIVWVEFDDGSRHSLWEPLIHAKLREQLALVPQIAYISSDSLATNISFTHDHDEADLLRSIQRAELLTDLEQFEDRSHQMIGESGVNLSGGQKQRVNLARAFHSKRPFLVLDDTLSAVDHRTEAKLMEAFAENPSPGLLLVTHRLSEIRSLGYVLVFQNGELIEEGKPEALEKMRNSAFVKALKAYQDV